MCVCAHSLHGLHCPYRSSHEVLLQQELHKACHWVWFLMRLSPALFFCSFCVFFSSFLFLRYIHSFGSHAEPHREGSSCRARAGWVGVGRASKQQVFVSILFMPGERVVWIPPERLCTGTKGWKEELCHSGDQGGGAWVRCS